MRKTLLLLFCVILANQALAQTKKTKFQNDSTLRANISRLPFADTALVPAFDIPIAFNQSMVFKLRLDSIQKTVPLNYNEFVQNYIDIYSKRKNQMGQMLGLGNYYFPIFEKALKEYNIPAEIKYLPIIESSMNPHAVSRVGATGMWQFMFATAKAYGLNMDNFVDERKDPIQASYAAAAYFRDSYEELGDWLLAIAAYNCGKTNVTRAIDKAGSRDFWQIRAYLPQETRNYVPAFIAAVYVMNYANKHDITEVKSAFNSQTDTVHVNHFVSLKDLAKVINYDEQVLANLNPSYKKKIINGSELLPKRVVLPKMNLTDYAAVYELINNDIAVDKNIVLASTDDARELRKKNIAAKPKVADFQLHKVSSGQNLSAIADQYHVEVQDLKVWNKLPTNTLVPGQNLKIYGAGAEPKRVSPKPRASFVTYKVKLGDTLSGIAEKFEGATVSNIKKLNGLNKAALQPGMILKINNG